MLETLEATPHSPLPVPSGPIGKTVLRSWDSGGAKADPGRVVAVESGLRPAAYTEEGATSSTSVAAAASRRAPGPANHSKAAAYGGVESGLGKGTARNRVGEERLRMALGKAETLHTAVQLLRDIEDQSRALLYTLARDMHLNFPELTELLEGGATGGNGVAQPPVNQQGSTSSSAVQPLRMVASGEIRELVLGNDCKY